MLSKDEAEVLADKLLVTWVVDNSDAAAPHTIVHKRTPVEDNGTFTLDLGAWNGPTQPGCYQIRVGVEATSQLPQIESAQLTLKLVPSVPSMLRLGTPQEARSLPRSMEVGDALRYHGVEQQEETPGTFSATEPLKVYCCDCCGNNVPFPTDASITLSLDRADAEANSSSGSPRLDPPVQELPCGGKMSVELPPTRLFDNVDSTTSGSYVLTIAVKSVGSTQHRFEYHTPRLQEAAKLLQNKINALKDEYKGQLEELQELGKEIEARAHSGPRARSAPHPPHTCALLYGNTSSREPPSLSLARSCSPGLARPRPILARPCTPSPAFGIFGRSELSR